MFTGIISADVITKTDGSLVEGTVLRVSDQYIEYSTDKLPFLKLDRNQVKRIQYRTGETVDVASAGESSANQKKNQAQHSGDEPTLPKKKRYSKAWAVEFGGSLGYSGFVLSINRSGSSSNSSPVHQVYIAPSFSVFLIDNFSLGFVGSYATIFGPGLSAPSAFAGYLNPAYTFDVGSNIFPYFSILAGYANSSDSSSTQVSSGGFGYGGRGGVKFAVGSDILIDCGLQYLVQTFSLASYASTSTEGISIKTFSFNVGISTWL